MQPFNVIYGFDGLASIKKTWCFKLTYFRQTSVLTPPRLSRSSPSKKWRCARWRESTRREPTKNWHQLWKNANQTWSMSTYVKPGEIMRFIAVCEKFLEPFIATYSHPSQSWGPGDPRGPFRWWGSRWWRQSPRYSSWTTRGKGSRWWSSGERENPAPTRTREECVVFVLSYCGICIWLWH